jgi:hypothetical protein
MTDQKSVVVRGLYAWEILEARRVFANRLDYERVRIHENVDWPNTINRLGSLFKRMPPPLTDNAVTLGNHCYFPVRLLKLPVPPAHEQHALIAWLIHELTHVWQYQQMGWRYLALALHAQLKYKMQAYEFGGESGLIECMDKGWNLADFNLEQQGDIARSYYEKVCKGEDVCAWEHFIAQIQH